MTIRARHAKAYRERAWTIAVLQSCICTYPTEEHDTSTHHDARCPSHAMLVERITRDDFAAMRPGARERPATP